MTVIGGDEAESCSRWRLQSDDRLRRASGHVDFFQAAISADVSDESAVRRPKEGATDLSRFGAREWARLN